MPRLATARCPAAQPTEVAPLDPTIVAFVRALAIDCARRDHALGKAERVKVSNDNGKED